MASAFPHTTIRTLYNDTGKNTKDLKLRYAHYTMIQETQEDLKLQYLPRVKIKLSRMYTDGMRHGVESIHNHTPRQSQ